MSGTKTRRARHVGAWHDICVARFLFVMLPIPSHITPALAIGQALAASGHDVAWCGPESDLRPLVGPDVTVYPTGKRSYRDRSGSGIEAIRDVWDGYIMPFNRFIMGSADRAVAEHRPDVVVVDQYALAGAMAALRHDVRWASLCTGLLELAPPTWELPGLPELVRSRLARVWAMAGGAAGHGIDLRFSPHLVIALSSPSFVDGAPLPEQCVLVGPALGRRLDDPAFPWDFLDPGRRHVLITVGTLVEHLSSGFYARMITALGPMAGRLQAVVVAPADMVPDPPAHVLVARRVPMLELMPRLDAVVCHGGLNTVSEALLHGLPLVTAPIQGDELTLARQVARAGAGVEVSFLAATPAQLAEAVTAVLDQPGYRTHAQRIGAELAEAGGASAAAGHLAALAARP
jgi:zeaxanthin glucosyltransferase